MDDRLGGEHGSAVPADLSGEIACRYGISGAATPIVGGGDECVVWRVDSRPPTVVRMSPNFRSLGEIAWTHRVVDLLSDVPEALRPLTARDGSTAFAWRDCPVSVWPFIDGVPLDRDEPDQRRRAAELLARLHRVAAAAGPIADRLTALPVRQPTVLPDPELDTWLRDWRPGPPFGVMHGDFYRRNILCRAGQIIGLIDWDEARQGPLITELARATWELCKAPAGDRLLADRAAQFVDEYRRAGGPAVSSDAMTPLIRQHLRAEVDAAEQARRRGEHIDADYQAAEIRAFTNLRPPALGE